MPPDDGPYTPGLEVGNSSKESGALGCFARLNSDPSVRVLLSCAHVLFANQRELQNLPIYQPPGSSTKRGPMIATTLNHWYDGFNWVHSETGGADPMGYGAQYGSQTDCAIAQVGEGISFTNEIPGGIGMIQGTPPAGDLGVVQGPNFSSTEGEFGGIPEAHHYVRFYSTTRNSVQWGTVANPPYHGSFTPASADRIPAPGISSDTLDEFAYPMEQRTLMFPWRSADASDELADALPNVGQLAILPRPPPRHLEASSPAERRQLFEQSYNGVGGLEFAVGGDSGSVVVNHENKVIGVVVRGSGSSNSPYENAGLERHPEWAATSGITMVTPIHWVLEKMAINIPANFSSSSSSAGQPQRTPMTIVDPYEVSVRRAASQLRKDLAKSLKGRRFIETVFRHHEEASHIVHTNRQALVAWHRNKGPAFVQHCMHNLNNTSHMIAHSINGISQYDLLNIMADIMQRFGSERLVKDIHYYRKFVLQNLTNVKNLRDLPALFKETEDVI